MGYRGKVELRERARELRLQGWTLKAIADELRVSKSSVSLWVRDLAVVVEQSRRSWWSDGREHPAAVRARAEIAELDAAGRERLGTLSTEAFLAAGAALYAGEGGKTPGTVLLANSDPAVICFFLAWLRTFFEVDESRLHVRLYLHDGLDLEATERYWAGLTGIPLVQFHKAYRAVADSSIRHNKHEHGCPRVTYACTRTHRAIMGLVRALLSSNPAFRGGAIGSASDC